MKTIAMLYVVVALALAMPCAGYQVEVFDVPSIRVPEISLLANEVRTDKGMVVQFASEKFLISDDGEPLGIITYNNNYLTATIHSPNPGIKPYKGNFVGYEANELRDHPIFGPLIASSQIEIVRIERVYRPFCSNSEGQEVKAEIKRLLAILRATPKEGEIR